MKRPAHHFLPQTLLWGACAILCLLVAGTALADESGSICDRGYVNGWHQKDWVDVTYGMKRARVCLANMRSNGLLEAIDSVWAGNPAGPDIGRAIACHESSGVTGALEYGRQKGAGGACAFQIDPKSDYSSVASGIGVKREEFLDKILSDPVSCAKAGYYVLRSLSGAGRGLPGGLCNYFGGAHYKEFAVCGKCLMEKEILLVREYVESAMNGTDPDLNIEVQKDPTKDCYGCYTISGGSVGTIAVLNCHSQDKSFSSDLAKAAIEYQNAVVIASSEAEILTWNAQVNHPVLLKRPDLVCIDRIDTYFGGLTSLIDDYQDGTLEKKLGNKIIQGINGLGEQLLQAACSVAVQGVNNLLEMICLPLPDLSLPNFQFPGLNRISCDGLSLGDYVSVSQNGNPLGSLKRAGAEAGLLPDDPVDTSIPSMPSVNPYGMIRKQPSESYFFNDKWYK